MKLHFLKKKKKTCLRKTYVIIWIIWMKWFHRLIGSDIIERCGLIGVRMALLQDIYYWEWALESQK